MIQPSPAGAAGGAGAPAAGAGPAPADPTAQIDQNNAQIQRFQNQSEARSSMWQAVMAQDEKAWKILEGIINAIKT